MSLQFDIERWEKEKFEELSFDNRSVDYNVSERKKDFKVIKDFRNGTVLVVYFFKALGELTEGHHHILTLEDIQKVITTIKEDTGWNNPEEKQLLVNKLLDIIPRVDFQTQVLTWSWWD